MLVNKPASWGVDDLPCRLTLGFVPCREQWGSELLAAPRMGHYEVTHSFRLEKAARGVGFGRKYQGVGSWDKVQQGSLSRSSWNL